MRIPLLFFKMGFFIFAISLGVLFLGYEWGGRPGLFWALGFSVLWMSLLWFSNESNWLDTFSVTQLSGQDPWGLVELVQTGAQRLHVDPPKIYLVHSRSAFLLSLTLGAPSDILLLSRPLVEHLHREEIEALVLSELASLWLRRRLRVRWFHLIALSIVRLGEFVDQSFPWGRRLQFFQRALVPFSQLILKLILWNRFEVEQDRLAVSIVKDRRALASAMWKLESMAQAHPLRPPPGSEHLFLIHPGRAEDSHFLSMRSPLSVRMRRILGAEMI